MTLDLPEVNEDNLVNFIMDWEVGEGTTLGFIALFAYLVKTGKAWSLQGSYGRTAKALIDEGLMNDKGEVNHAELADRLNA